MKFIITGDIHLKIKEPNDFNERRFFNLLYEIEKENPDIVILNGDIFDKANPSWYEIKKYYEWINRLSQTTNQIFVLSGNHEELSKNSSLFDYLPQYDYVYKDLDKLVIGETTLWLVSHHKIEEIYKLKRQFITSTNILISHYRSKVNKFMTSEIDNIYVAKTFDYTILSDIHMHFKPAENIEYTSSPYSVNFTNQQEYGFIILTIDNEGKDYNLNYKKLNLPCRIKYEIKTEDDFIKFKVDYEKNKKHIYKLVSYIKLDDSKKDWIKNQERIVQFLEENNIVNEEKIEEVVDELKSDIANYKITDLLKELVAPQNEIEKKLMYELELIEKEL